MITEDEYNFFWENGYLLVRQVVDQDHRERLTEEFEKAWAAEAKPDRPSVCQYQLLKYPGVLELIEHPPILDRHKAIFGSQVQLLQCDLLRHGPGHDAPERAWHRDFHFPGDNPMSINTIVYLDPMTAERGPTLVLPGSHRGWDLPYENDAVFKRLPGEIEVECDPGDAVFINSAVWHSGGVNRTDGFRRAYYMYYGYWWLKRYHEDQRDLPWEAFVDASEQRLRLLGMKMPGPDVHMFRPDGGRPPGNDNSAKTG